MMIVKKFVDNVIPIVRNVLELGLTSVLNATIAVNIWRNKVISGVWQRKPVNLMTDFLLSR